ncbi:MAG: SemiSWEET transporter [bacterium]
MIETVGYIAAFLTTIAAIPQLIKIIRSKHANDISIYMFLISFIGFSLWLIYGFLTSSKPLIIANIITLIIFGLIIFFKLKYTKK